MRHNPVPIEDIPISDLNDIDSASYDNPYVLKNSEGTLSLTVAHVNSGNEHIPKHYFLPWGWSLDVPVLRQYNLYLQKNYHGDIYFYSLQHIGLTTIDKKQSVLEQIARRWLEAQVDQGVIVPGKPVSVEGTSMGGALAGVIASLASEYNITLGNLNMFEPAGMTKKSAYKMLQEVSADTKQDYLDSFGGNLEVRHAKAKIILAAIKNGNVQARCIQEIADGDLAKYVNKYLETQDGEVHIGHGAESSFMTLEDLDAFSKRLIDSSRVQSFDFLGCRHGFGGKALGLSSWYGKHTAEHQ